MEQSAKQGPDQKQGLNQQGPDQQGMNQSAGERLGTRCHICTGCGRCLAEAGDSGRLHVVMPQADLMQVDLPQADLPPGNLQDKRAENRNKRLVTTDIGTTTLAMQLYGVNGEVAAEYSCVNPQVKYGADVLSRIQAAADRAAADEMRRMILEKLAEGLAGFRECLQPAEELFMVLAGNTTMIYLLMGYDPAELGHAPFTASHLDGMETELAGVRTWIFPGLSAFVGGDIVAGIYACGMRERQDTTLLIDLGTNGEMVLGNAGRQIACATAAGPAFEGGVNRGIWGSDMVHLIAELRKRNLVDDTGLLAEPYFEQGILIGDVHVTQESIRAIQLAKGAIGAGIQILMQKMDSMDRIDRVILAGGFGYYLNPADAAYIKLLPEELAAKTVAGGNTALAGAFRLGRKVLAGEIPDWQAAFRRSAAGDREQSVLSGIGGEIEILNLAKQPDFEQLYLENMGL